MPLNKETKPNFSYYVTGHFMMKDEDICMYHISRIETFEAFVV